MLIDGDIVAYECACRHQRVHDFAEDGTEPLVVTDMEGAKQNVGEFIRNLKDRFSASKVFVALSDPCKRYWRHDVLPSYKQNRTGSVPPVLLKDLKEWMASHPSTVIRPRMEADDVLGIMSGRLKNTIICSVDKDMDQLPGTWYNWRKDETTEVNEEHAYRFHMFQTLMGDPVDGYKGCPGIGPVKAERIAFGANSLKDLWEIVVATYAEKGLTEEDALVQARVARILRIQDYNLKTKEIKLWNPPSDSESQ